MTDTANQSRFAAIALLTCRFVAGGAFLLAALLKLRDPQTFMLSIEAFDLAPAGMIPFLAYLIPWMEVVAGLLLIYGAWSRAAGLVAVGLYGMFTAAILISMARGKDLSCGCFGDFFGDGGIGWMTVLRNMVFLLASGAVLLKGGGRLAVDALASPALQRDPRADPAPAPAPASSTPS